MWQCSCGCDLAAVRSKPHRVIDILIFMEASPGAWHAIADIYLKPFCATTVECGDSVSILILARRGAVSLCEVPPLCPC